MRKTLLALIVTLATLTPAGIAVAGEPFAVVELFTSQGCSSCPGAEAVLRDLSAHARESGLRIIPIEWHVDYWDRLGWPDPFGDPEHSQRQRRYARALGQRGPYTPQIIVNGTTIVRPAQRRQLVFDQAETALEQPAQAEITLSAGPRRASPGRLLLGQRRAAAGGDDADRRRARPRQPRAARRESGQDAAP